MKNSIKPDYLFEVSWEVCNKVGGIYAVLSTKAATLKKQLGDNPDDDAIQTLLEEEVSKVNKNLVNYKHIKRVVRRDTEFDKTTSKKIRRQYKK
jgi:hypothetical protein